MNPAAFLDHLIGLLPAADLADYLVDRLNDADLWIIPGEQLTRLDVDWDDIYATNEQVAAALRDHHE